MEDKVLLEILNSVKSGAITPEAAKNIIKAVSKEIVYVPYPRLQPYIYTQTTIPTPGTITC